MNLTRLVWGSSAKPEWRVYSSGLWLRWWVFCKGPLWVQKMGILDKTVIYLLCETEWIG